MLLACGANAASLSASAVSPNYSGVVIADGDALFSFGSANAWVAGEHVTLAETRFFMGDIGACLYAECDNRAGTDKYAVKKEFAQPLNLLAREFVSADFYVESDGADTALAWIIVRSGETARSFSQEIGTNGIVTVNADVSSFSGRRSVTAVEFAVSATSPGEDIACFRVSDVTAGGSANIGSVARFGSASGHWRHSGCTVEYDGEAGTLTLTPTDTATDTGVAAPMSIAAPFVYDSAAVPVSDAMRVALRNDGAATSATLSVNGGADITVPISSGEGAYLFRYAATQVEEISLSISADAAGAAVVISSVAALYAGDGASEEPMPATITRAEYADGELTVRGTLSSDEAARRIGSTFALYALPSYADSIAPDATPVATAPLSTRFEFKASVPSVTASVSRYIVAVTDGVTAVPVSAARFASPAGADQPAALTQSQGAASLGVDASGASRVVESGFSVAVIDVPCELLVSGVSRGEGVVRLYTRGGSRYYFSGALTEELDAKVREYSAAGIDVYLRLVLRDAADAEAMTYSEMRRAASYAFNTSDAEGVNQLCATAGYLASRYSGGLGVIAGIIVGQRAESACYNQVGAPVETLSDYVRAYADALRLVRNTAAQSIPAIRVCASVGDGTVYEGDGDGYVSPDVISGSSADSVDPALFISLLSARISASGGFDWYVFAESGADVDDIYAAAEFAGAVTDAVSRESHGAFCAPKGALFMWQLPASTSFAGYDVIAESFDGLRTRLAESAPSLLSLVLSVSRQPDEVAQDVMSRMRGIGGGDADSDEAYPVDGEFLAAFAGDYAYWDFTSSYNSGGWFAGEGCSSVETYLSDERKLRLLRISFDGSEGGAACMALASADSAEGRAAGSTLDLSLTPVVVFGVTARTGGGGSVPLTFMVGGGGERAEFDATVTSGERTLLALDLSSFGEADAVEFLAVYTRSAEAVTVDVSDIRGYSEQTSGEQLREAVVSAAQSGAATSGEGDGVGITVAVALFVLSAVAVTALSRKRPEHEDGDAEK